ncbi:DNA primase, partial [Pantoea agglomerans]|nr:DNA primase [Pantoea agglomerans]
TLRIYMRQELGNKLGILDDNQLEKLMPKLVASGTTPVAPPIETLRIYMRQELGNKLGILDDNQLEKLMPKLVASGTTPVAP